MPHCTAVRNNNGSEHKARDTTNSLKTDTIAPFIIGDVEPHSWLDVGRRIILSSIFNPKYWYILTS